LARSIRFLLALGAFFVLVAALAACGNGVPGNAVVRVDDAVIKKSTFNHWLRIAVLSNSQQQPGVTAPKPVVPDPPDFKACIVDKRKTAPQPGKGQPKVTDASLKAQCKQEYGSLRDEVLQFLIQAEWLKGEAKDQGIKVSDKTVNASFDKQKKQAFPKEADFQAFLKSSGMNLDDIKLRVEVDLLTNKIRDKITKGKKPTEKQIQAYYDKNKQRFSQPERRDVLVVLTKSGARAGQAKAALRKGQNWASVARRYSTDPASKSQGGKLPGVIKGQQDKGLDAAVFSAQVNQLRGPIKTSFGYYVFKVTKVTPASQQTLEQSRKTIVQLLQTQGQQQRLQAFVKKFQKKWKERTNCRKGFIIATCKNAPEPKKTSTTPPGAVPQGGATGAPQQGAPTQGAPTQGAPTQGTPQQGAPTPQPTPTPAQP
jgi:foldase protein PrsA